MKRQTAASKNPASTPAQDVAGRLQMLRTRCGLSMRQLARLSGVTAAMISCIERGKASPSLATLQKILAALSTDLHGFFADGGRQGAGPVYARERMAVARDGERQYTIVFPRDPAVRMELIDERHYPGHARRRFETLACDVAGYVLDGELALEVAGQGRRIVRTGDAFYIPRGTRHRGTPAGAKVVRILTSFTPPRY